MSDKPLKRPKIEDYPEVDLDNCFVTFNVAQDKYIDQLEKQAEDDNTRIHQFMNDEDRNWKEGSKAEKQNKKLKKENKLMAKKIIDFRAWMTKEKPKPPPPKVIKEGSQPPKPKSRMK